MSVLRKFYYRLPPGLRLLSRKLFYAPIDIFESVTGMRGKYVPPRGDIYIGSGDFLKLGKEQLSLLIKHISLGGNDKVLDVGCGIGRTALPLTEYLTDKGAYEGFDVVEKGITWCNSTIGRDFPNFHFRYVPLNNDLYNEAEGRASDFVFPYTDAEFDKVFLFSVFTHMQVDEIGHYLSEIARVLKPQGACLATFFLFDDTIEEVISGRKKFNFPVKKDGYRLMDEKVRSANIALHEETLAAMVANSGLQTEKIIPGYWKDLNLKGPDNTFQDLVVLRRRSG